jgi:hypothetical protein
VVSPYHVRSQSVMDAQHRDSLYVIGMIEI